MPTATIYADDYFHAAWIVAGDFHNISDISGMNCCRRRFMLRASAWIVAGDNSCHGDNSCRNTPLGQKWVPKMADVIFDVRICYVHRSYLISCYYLISTVRYQNKSHKVHNWICGINFDNPGLNSLTICLQVSIVPTGRLLTPVEK